MNVYFVDGNDNQLMTCAFSHIGNPIIIGRGNGFKENYNFFRENENKDIDVYTNDEEFLEYGWDKDGKQLNLWFYYEGLGFVHKDYVYPALRLVNNIGKMFRAGMFDLTEEEIERIKKELLQEKKKNGKK